MTPARPFFRYPDGMFALIYNASVTWVGENTTEIYGDKGVIIQNHGDAVSASIQASLSHRGQAISGGQGRPGLARPGDAHSGEPGRADCGGRPALYRRASRRACPCVQRVRGGYPSRWCWPAIARRKPASGSRSRSRKIRGWLSSRGNSPPASSEPSNSLSQGERGSAKRLLPLGEGAPEGRMRGRSSTSPPALSQRARELGG
jgi:hypothetical protein